MKYIRLFDDNSSALFDLYEPQKLVQSLRNPQNEISDFRNTYNNDSNFDVRLSFGLGVISEINQYYFDGRTKHMAAYEKAVVILAFNRGFLINEGKNVYKSYINILYAYIHIYFA